MTALLGYFFLALFLSFLCSLLEAVLLSTPSSYASILSKQNPTHGLRLEKFKENIISKIPSGRLGEPEDVANAVLFLASAKSDYINGETLHVNGGMYMA